MAASVEASARERTGSSTASTRTVVTGAWSYPRIIVRLAPDDLSPTKALTDDVRAALAAETTEDKFYALRAVFDRYGQVWASEVTLGGQLVLTDEATLDSAQQEAEAEAAMRAAVSVKVGMAKGSASVAAGTASASRSKLVDQFQQKQLTATGGDTRLVEDSAVWTPTVGPVVNWRVIGRRGLLPLYEVLDHDLRREVRAVLETVDARFIPPTFEAASPDPAPAGELTRAERDGLLVVVLRAPAGTAASVAATSAPGGAPSGLPMYATCSDVKVRNVAITQQQTLTIPVRRGDSYLVDRLQGDVPGLPVRLFQAVEIGRPLFDSLMRLGDTRDGLSEWTAPAAGLLLVTASAAHGWFGGNVDVTVDGELLASTGVCTAPTEWSGAGRRAPHGSMCIPVLAGTTYRITCTRLDVPATAGAPAAMMQQLAAVVEGSGLTLEVPWAEAAFVGFDPAVAGIGEPFAGSDDVYRAESDGLLLCCARSNVLTTYEVLAGPDRSTFQKSEPRGAVLVGVLAGTGLSGLDWHEGATLTVPIRRGEYYVVTSSTPRPLDRMLFFPLRRF
jgi:hypothetical protein